MWSRVAASTAFATVAVALASRPPRPAKRFSGSRCTRCRAPADKIAEAAEGVELAGVRADGVGHQRRRRPDREPAREARRLRRQGHADAQQEGPDGHRAGRRPGGRRLQRLALLGRAGRHPRRALSTSPARTRSSSSSRSSGTTHQGRELIALKLTQGARDEPDGSRPAVLYSSNQHAREWISLEVNRRLLHYFIDRWRANDKEIKDLLKTTELWFVISANPDGYQYTFDHERLWRKNLRDNNGDGQITVGDGVDPEPQLRRALGLRQRGLVAGPGGRDLSRSERRLGARDAGDAGPDRPHQAEVPVEPALVRPVAAVPAGLAGRHARRRLPALRRRSAALDGPIPAIPGFNPGQSADTLYVTNGETTDYADTNAGTVAYTPELGEGSAGRGLRVPRRRGADPGGVREDARLPPGPGQVGGASRESGLAGRASTSSRSTSTRTRSIRRTGRQSLFDFKFDVSYGDPQEVRVLAKRSLGAVTLQLPDQRRRGPERADQRVERRRALRPRQRRPTTTCDAAR